MAKNKKGQGWTGDKQRHSDARKYGSANPRRTIGPEGKRVKVPKNENVYLGRSVKDTVPKGLSDVSEVDEIGNRIVKDERAGVIDKRTANARTLRLKAATERTQKGELKTIPKKKAAIRKINKDRKRIDPKWKNLSTDPTIGTTSKKK